METMTQNGSGPSTESQEDEGRKSLAELKHLWEGMASRNERPLNSEVQRKPQLVRRDTPRQIEIAGASKTSLLATVSDSMTTPTSSVATATISLVTPSSSTTKVKRSVTTPTSPMATTQNSTATAPSSMTSAIPMKTQTSSIATASTNFRTTQANFIAKSAISMATPVGSMAMQASSKATSVNSMSTAPRPMTTYAISVTTPASSMTIAANSVTTTMSSTSSSGVLKNDATSSNDAGSSSSRSAPFAAERCVKVDGPNRSEILSLVDDGSDGARQTVTVERTEEELTNEMMEALQMSGDPSKGVTNVDVVEERLDVELSNGQARVKVIIHCERIVPNRCSQSYRKSSVTVTRITEVDMLATPERRRIYERVLDRYGAPEETSHQTALVPRNRLRTDDVYVLYQVFVEVIGGSGSLLAEPENQLTNVLSKTEVAGLELLRRQSFPLSLLRLGPPISPVSSAQ